MLDGKEEGGEEEGGEEGGLGGRVKIGSFKIN